MREAATPKKRAKYYFSGTLRPAASSLSRAICVQVRLRTGGSATGPRRASSSGEIGGKPAVPKSEFTSARFSPRKRATMLKTTDPSVCTCIRRFAQLCVFSQSGGIRKYGLLLLNNHAAPRNSFNARTYGESFRTGTDFWQ